MVLALADIQAAAEQLRGEIVRTPCTRSRTLSELTGAQVWVKFENLQFTGSFKERGALIKLLSLDRQQRRRGVVAMSAGNHAQGVAYHARRLHIPVVIVMPRYTPNIKAEQTRRLGAEVILEGEQLTEARACAEALAVQRDLTLVHPYDDELVMAGQGTIALEMLAERPDLEVLLIPIGGGGLISGNATAAKALRPDIQVVGVEARNYPSMRQALRGEPVQCGRYTLAEGIAVKEPGRKTLEVIRRLVDDIVLVDELEIEQAVLLYLEIEKTVAEGAAAAGLAALLKERERFRNRRVGLILCGGNIDMLTLASVIHRGLARSERLVRLRLPIRDVPGALADACADLAAGGANIVGIHHQRAFATGPLQIVETEFILQLRGPEHLRELRLMLADRGHRAITPDLEPKQTCPP